MGSMIWEVTRDQSEKVDWIQVDRPVRAMQRSLG